MFQQINQQPSYFKTNRKSKLNLKQKSKMRKWIKILKALEQIPAKGKCFCPLAEAEERVQESHEEQEEGPPEPDDWDAAASHQDDDQRDPPVLPPPPEELLPQTVEDIPVDIVEMPTPPPVEVVKRAVQRPLPVSQRGGQETASTQSETDPGQGMRGTHTGRPTRIRKTISKFSTWVYLVHVCIDI